MTTAGQVGPRAGTKRVGVGGGGQEQLETHIFLLLRVDPDHAVSSQRLVRASSQHGGLRMFQRARWAMLLVTGETHTHPDSRGRDQPSPPDGGGD